MTQGELGAAIGKAYQQISEWERGDSNLRTPNLYAVAKALAVRPEWLRSGEGPMDFDLTVKTKDGTIGIMAKDSSVAHYDAMELSPDLALMESVMLVLFQELQEKNLVLTPERTVAGVFALYETAKSQGRTSITKADLTPYIRLMTA